MSSTLLRSVLFWLPVLAWMALIFVLSSQSGLRASEDDAVEKPLRVVAHLLAFGGLSALLLLALSRGRHPTPVAALLAFVVAVIYGATDELHQSFVPERAGRIDDLLVDAVGAAIGVGLGWVVLVVRARGRRSAIDSR